MGYEFKISKNIIVIILFLFVFGIVIQLSQSNYIVQLNTGNGPVDNNKIVQTSALSSKQAKDFIQDKVLIVFDPKEPDSEKLLSNLEKTLEYMKKDYQAVTNTSIPANVSGYKNIIIAFDDLDMVSDITRLTAYANKGGNLFFAIRPESGNNLNLIYRNLGIFELGDDSDSYGIKLDSDLLMQNKNLKVNGDLFYNSSLAIHLNETCRLLATSANGETPLLWSTKYGKGTVMVFNGTMLEDKWNRGFITGALSYLNDDYIYPIMNSKVAYIDDFPAPFPDGYNKQIYQDYKRDISTFFRDIWWPDMEESAAKNDIKYTGVLIETYNNHVKGPFNDEAGLENLKSLGRDLIKSGGEIGMHGYNHQSLTQDSKADKELGYNTWKSEKDMEDSLQAAKEYFNAVFPKYTLRTYVPPSNVISEAGKDAIHKAIPSINTIASLYTDDPSSPTYIQDPEEGKTFIELPRFTSGYEYTDSNKWFIANNATLFGAFSHFVHPDDILDKNRSDGENWEQLFKQYNQMLADVLQKYPWMKSMTAAQSADALTNYLNAKVFISQHNNEISVSINHFTGQLDFLLRSDKKIKSTKNCKVEKVSADRYLVHAHADYLEIHLGG